MADLASLDSYDELPEDDVVEQEPQELELPEIPEPEIADEPVQEWQEPEVADDTMPELPEGELPSEPSMREASRTEGRQVAFADQELELPSRNEGGGELFGILSSIEQRLAAIESSLANAMGYTE